MVYVSGTILKKTGSVTHSSLARFAILWLYSIFVLGLWSGLSFHRLSMYSHRFCKNIYPAALLFPCSLPLSQAFTLFLPHFLLLHMRLEERVCDSHLDSWSKTYISEDSTLTSIKERKHSLFIFLGLSYPSQNVCFQLYICTYLWISKCLFFIVTQSHSLVER